MSTQRSAGRVRTTYEFIKAHRGQYPVEAVCRVLGVAASGYYAWLQQPRSRRALEDARLLRLIRASFVASHGVYGAPRVFLDLREAGETCSKHRVMRVMRENGLRALHGYRTRRWAVGKPAILTPNLLQRSSRSRGRTSRGSRTSRTYARGKGGSLWRSSSISSPERSSGGLGGRRSIASSSSMRS
jgi:putative transposase